jgi:hypothetical protein
VGKPKDPIEKLNQAALDAGINIRELFALVWDAGFAASYAWQEMRRATPSNLEVPAPPNPMRDERIPIDFDDIAVARFAMAMIEKLAAKRADTYRERLWDNRSEISQAHLSQMLYEHIFKGDPIDVAAFACFLWNRGESINMGKVL